MINLFGSFTKGRKGNSVGLLSALIGLGVLAALLTVSCAQEEKPASEKVYKIAVFVPGLVEGSPTYEMMVDGVKLASEKLTERGLTLDYKVVEGGYNQGEWKSGLLSLALEGSYSLIVSSNPSLPDLALSVLESFPEQKFLLLDSVLEGNPNVKTIGFKHYEQAYLNGYFAALVSGSGLRGTNSKNRLGLLAGQEYPVMNEQIKTGFLDGARAVARDFELDFRVLGNWYDAAKADELAKSMTGAGSDVILTIAGGGNQGVIAAARETGTYVTWFDSPGYSFGPGVVLGSTEVSQSLYCRDAVVEAALGSLDFGVADLLGVKEGAVNFVHDPATHDADPILRDIVAKVRALTDDVRAGRSSLGPKN